tara:strand:- start:1026 stop:1937 length:912 start_codon:yes stop_codon:yes gene_type:complete
MTTIVPGLVTGGDRPKVSDMRSSRWLLFASLFLAAPAMAQDPAEDPIDDPVEDPVPDPTDPSDPGPIATDRPGAGNAPTTVPQWAFQLETSVNWAYTDTDPGSVHQVSFPTLLRFGLLDVFEVRLGSSLLGLYPDPAPGFHVANPTDTSLGLKIQLLENVGAIPALGLVSDVYFPSGRDPFTADTVNPDSRVALSWSLPASFSLGVNLGIDVPEGDSGRYGRFLYVANVGWAPAALGGVSLFVETFGLVPLGVDEDVVIQVDWGATYVIRRVYQVDLFVQHGLTDGATDLQVALGFSARFGGA